MKKNLKAGDKSQNKTAAVTMGSALQWTMNAFWEPWREGAGKTPGKGPDS